MKVREMANNEKLSFTTVRIECDLPTGAISCGTGFLFNFVERGEKGNLPCIVTNKHVVRGAVSGRFHMHNVHKPTEGAYHTFALDRFESRWIPHPEDNIDLCIMPISNLLSSERDRGHALFFQAFDTSLIPSDEQFEDFTALEQVVMIGYPNGIWDEVNNFPVFRQGVTATQPGIDYNGKAEFLTDMACFPGSSGSPVLLYSQGSYATRDGITLGSRLQLLGVLYAGHMYAASGDVVVEEIPTVQAGVSSTKVPMNLGLVIRSTKLMDFEKILEQMLERSMPS